MLPARRHLIVATGALLGLGAAGERAALAALAGAECATLADVDALDAGQWCQVPSSRLDAPGVRPQPVPPGSQAQNVFPWSGGAYDRKRDRYIVWGGGHMDYSGNEVYVFDLATLRWSRASDPASNVGGNEPSGYYPSNDGAAAIDTSQPRSRHTYNYVQYVDAFDRFCTFGGAALYPSGQTGSPHADCFDFDARRWTPINDTVAYGIGSKSAVDCRTGHIWVQGTVETYGLGELDPAANRWTLRRPNDDNFRYSYGMTADIDPAGRRMIAAGENKVSVWDLADPTKVTQAFPALHGDLEILGKPAPGFAYDFHAQTMVAWAGGTDVFTVQADAANAVVTRRPAGAANQVPADALAATPTGTFGRWRYIPSHNVFIIVNGLNTNVFLYRHTAGPGAPADCQSGVAPPPVVVPDGGGGGGGRDAGEDGGGGPDLAPALDAGGDGGDGEDAGAPVTSGGGCGCALHAKAPGARGAWAAALALGLLLAARRRRH